MISSLTPLMTSKNQEWETPYDFFLQMHLLYRFTIDCCATKENKKLDRFWSPQDDALTKSWAYERVWMNPPYQRRKPSQADWVRKAHEEVCHNNCELVACLLPARTDTKLFHDYVMKYAKKVIFVRGRLRFVGARDDAVFPSMVVIFHSKPVREVDPEWSSKPVFETVSARSNLECATRCKRV